MAEAVKQGVLVVRATRVGSGFVNRNVEVNDDQMGFAVSLDLNPQKARILLQLLIAMAFIHLINLGKNRAQRYAPVCWSHFVEGSCAILVCMSFN